MATARHAGAAGPDPDAVLNQPPPLRLDDLYSSDRALVEATRREGAGWAEERLSQLGRLAASEEMIGWGIQANANPPVLRTHDRYGHRIDEVEFHPAWHNLLQLSVGHALHALPWIEPRPGSHAARAAAFYLMAQVEAGHGCPISMTHAIVPALRAEPELAEEWEPGLTSLSYDPGLRPAAGKRGLLAGMGMTERQGGSDVRANTTRADPVGGGGPGGEYLLTGHKWFCSAPMSDVFLVLAQAREGLSCFLLPRVLPDGSRNAFHIQRLKEKLGNRSNASSEVELQGAWARMVGEAGRGIGTILEMVNHTRLDCVVGSAALMRQALLQAIHHASYRRAFGRLLIEQPLMRNVLGDLALESEAATALALRLAGAFDRARDDPREAAFRRLATALGKFWVCKRGPAVVGEALECLGGNGYVEESGMPRLYREMPLNAIWEGSGNVIALDALRAMARQPETVEAFRAELLQAKGEDDAYDAALAAFERRLHGVEAGEAQARRTVEEMALLLQASLLIRHEPHALASAFTASRLDPDRALGFGALPDGCDLGAILDRAAVAPIS